MNAATKVSSEPVFTVRDMPHFTPYLQFLLNIVQIHLEYAKQGNPDYNISTTIDQNELNNLYEYLCELKPDAPVVIHQEAARVLYACLVVVSRMLICDYGEFICGRLISKLPPQHRWHSYETFRNDLLRQNSQMLLDMNNNMGDLIDGLRDLRQSLETVTL